MIFRTNEEFYQYFKAVFDDSGLSQVEMAMKINSSRLSVQHAVNQKNASDTGRNGVRFKILEYLGYCPKKVIEVTRQ